MSMILNLGCGFDRAIDGAINLDVTQEARPDLIADISRLPFADDTFDTVYCKDAIEHVENVVKTVEEIHRISKNGARLHVTTPTSPPLIPMKTRLIVGISVSSRSICSGRRVREPSSRPLDSQ